MIVTILDRGADGWAMRFPTITISDHCAVCCGPRGIPYRRNFYEDGDSYSVDCWDNPCGHVDHYRAMLKEAEVLSGQ